MENIELTPSDFVALLNQTLEFAYPNVVVTGELANFRVSKNQWVYFDIKDETASVKCFGTVYQLPGPLEDGMLVRLRGTPRLHPLYGFSLTTQQLTPAGEGSIKKASKLLEAQLRAEGLFDAERKRPLPYPPQHIGLITSGESAAFHDFMKILNARWRGVRVTLIDVQVQGEPAVAQIVRAIEQFGGLAEPPEVLVLTRGGGSAEDLQAFSTEQVTRAVAASRIPTLVAIGHEVDLSLAELAADRRASTPSNAAELLTPDRGAVFAELTAYELRLAEVATRRLRTEREGLQLIREELLESADRVMQQSRQLLEHDLSLLQAFNPQAALRRGYALVRAEGGIVHSGHEVHSGVELSVELADARLTTLVKTVTMNKE